MININTYAVTERYVYQGVSAGVGELLKDVENFKKPDVVMSTIVEAVMVSLCEVMDFGDRPVRFTPDVMRKILALAQEDDPSPPPS